MRWEGSEEEGCASLLALARAWEWLSRANGWTRSVGEENVDVCLPHVVSCVSRHALSVSPSSHPRSQGFKTAILGRTLEKLEALASANPGVYHPCAADASDPKSLSAALESVEKELGEIDVVLYSRSWESQPYPQDDCNTHRNPGCTHPSLRCSSRAW